MSCWCCDNIVTIKPSIFPWPLPKNRKHRTTRNLNRSYIGQLEWQARRARDVLNMWWDSHCWQWPITEFIVKPDIQNVVIIIQNIFNPFGVTRSLGPHPTSTGNIHWTSRAIQTTATSIQSNLISLDNIS